jgi:hypothetical protein
MFYSKKTFTKGIETLTKPKYLYDCKHFYACGLYKAENKNVALLKMLHRAYRLMNFIIKVRNNIYAQLGSLYSDCK